MKADKREGGIVAKTLNRLLPTLLPDNGKRAVFLTTLFMEISKISPTHKELLHQLNEKLHLAPTDLGLELPSHLHDIVWGGRCSNIRRIQRTEDVNDAEVTGMAKRLIRECSEWSHYGDYTKVLEETKEVIRATMYVENTLPQ